VVSKEVYSKSIEIHEKCSKDRTGEYICRELGVISCSTYFRCQKILEEQNKGIALPSKRLKKVRQPRRPDYNGGVERGNRTFR
jgi:hypothetical protein